MKYEKWSFGYWTLKQYVRFVDWVIHNKTILLNTHKIPKNKPLLFAPNHQNALSDPLAILLNLKLQPVWLGRADIFKNKMVAAILRFLKIMPVYRLRDGKDKLPKNDITFANSVKVLQNNGALALFPEGQHTGKKQMIAHKKAVPRIVFMAEEKAKGNLNIQIIPTGIYYSSYWKFNRNLIVDFGDPISANEFTEVFRENPNAATLSIRNKIYDGLKSLIINIESKTHYDDFENITEIYGKHFLNRQNTKYSIVNLFKSNRILAKKLDELENTKPQEIKKLVEEINDYRKRIKKHKVRNWLIEKPKNNVFRIAINKLILIAGLPVFIFGFLFNAIPFFTVDTILRKKIKDIAFWSTFSLGLGMIVFPLMYLVEFIAVSDLIQGVWLKLAFLFSLPFTGKLAFKWYILFRKTIGRVRLFYLKVFKQKQYTTLLASQKSIIEKLDSLIDLDLVTCSL